MLVESYHLKSDLARVCLPYPQGHPERTLAWVNSICFLFLFIALSGARPGLPTPKPVPPLEEPVPIIIQPLPPTPPPQAEQPNKEESTDDKAPAPRVVVVTLDSPAISFSVPTIGNVLVPNAIAQAPPARRPKPPRWFTLSRKPLAARAREETAPSPLTRKWPSNSASKAPSCYC